MASPRTRGWTPRVPYQDLVRLIGEASLIGYSPLDPLAAGGGGGHQISSVAMWGPRWIAKLVYNSNNYGLWYANNYSYWGL